MRACRELTPAQRDVLYYLRTLDPYSTGMEVSPARIAKDLFSAEKPVHRSTVGRALKALDEKGFVDMELLKVKVHVLTKGLHCCLIATSVIVTQQARSPRNKRQPKALPDEDSSISKINKTYLDFIKTLSEGKRESFEKFVRDEWKKQTAKKGEPGEEIISLERFLSNPEDLNNWWRRFLNSAAGRAAKKQTAVQTHDWRNDSRFEKWIWSAFERGYEWIHESEQEREVRKAFYDWAFAVNAFEGVCI